MGRYDDRAAKPFRGTREVLRWRLDRLAGRKPADPAPNYRPPRQENDGALLRSACASLTWIGHASFVLELGDKVVAIDPVWSNRLGGAVPRFAAPGLLFEALPPVDLVLITHNHRDHLDLPTLRRFGPGTRFLVPAGNGRLLRSAGLGEVTELEWWQPHVVDGLEVTLVPAKHWSMWLPWNRNDMLWGGYLLRGAEGTAYHSGDTGFDPALFEEIARRAGPIDWAMLPIGAYAPRWMMEPQHMDPEEAGRAFELLGARRFVAMHWGTFRLSDEPLSEPPARLRSWWRARGKPEEGLWLLDVGETRELRREPLP